MRACSWSRITPSARWLWPISWAWQMLHVQQHWYEEFGIPKTDPPLFSSSLSEPDASVVSQVEAFTSNSNRIEINRLLLIVEDLEEAHGRNGTLRPN